MSRGMISPLYNMLIIINSIKMGTTALHVCSVPIYAKQTCIFMFFLFLLKPFDQLVQGSLSSATEKLSHMLCLFRFLGANEIDMLQSSTAM